MPKRVIETFQQIREHIISLMLKFDDIIISYACQVISVLCYYALIVSSLLIDFVDPIINEFGICPETEFEFIMIGFKSVNLFNTDNASSTQS